MIDCLTVLLKSNTFWTAISAIATIFAAFYAFYKFRKTQKDNIKNAATFLLLDIIQMDKQRSLLVEMINKNQCELHFYRPIMSGCGNNLWPKNKAILLNTCLDAYQIETLENFYSIVCEVDDHLKRCKSDFYRAMRSEVTTEHLDAPRIITTLRSNLDNQIAGLEVDHCFTPSAVMTHILKELNSLPELSALKSTLNNIVNS